MLKHLFAHTVEVSAHCDLPCGVYDPAQARIEAESVKAITQKALDSDDPDFRTRAILIKEQRSDLVKHHLWVLWTDYFKPPHFEKYPQLHQLVNEATKLAGGGGGTKAVLDVETADQLLAKIDELAEPARVRGARRVVGGYCGGTRSGDTTSRRALG
jgi:nickel superoxide dismutase